jgi:aerobic-type carbon monoxide dehydrogenase small subunit (CoxS/CutS family)
MQIELELNGQVTVWEIAPGERLLDALRRHGLLAVKRGCETGDCGSCTVLLDDQPVNSCVVTAARAHGRRVLTLEGLRDDPLMQRLREAFVTAGAVQCGYCTPGMLITLFATIRANIRPTIPVTNRAAGGDLTGVGAEADLDETVLRHALSGNLCRCTGYVKPLAAARDVLAAWREASS